MTEIERRWRAGERISHAGKTERSIHISPTCVTADHHPKRSSKRRRGRRRRGRQRHPPSSQPPTAGNSLTGSTPTGSSSPGHSTSLESPPLPSPPENLINLDVDIPQPTCTPGQSMEGLMATLNIH